VPRNYPLPPSMIPATRVTGGELPGDPNGHSLFGGGGMPGGPSGFAGPEMGMAAPPPTTVDSLASLIMSTVAPESWRDAGGAIGTVRMLGTRLVVSQTAANQKQIEDLLNGIRDEGGGAYMVSVNAYWVQLTPEDLRVIAGKPTGDAAAAATLKEVPEALLTDGKLYSRGQTLGFNGQTVHVASGRANTVVTGMEPIVAQQAVGYQLETATIQSGVALQVTPQVLGDGKMISLDLHSVVSELHDAAALPDPRVLKDGPTTQRVEHLLGKRPSIAAQQFSTTARVPVGKKVLIGGMSFDPGVDTESTKLLYLVIEANAIK